MKAPALIKKAMKAKELSVIQLSDVTGIDDALIRRYLDGTVAVGVKNAPKLAKALDLDVAALLFGERAA